MYLPGSPLSMLKSSEKNHLQLSKLPVDERVPPEQESHNPQSHEKQPQGARPPSGVNSSQFGVENATIVATVAIRTQIIAIIAKQVAIVNLKDENVS